MIDVPVFLNIGVANRLTVNLCNKRIDSAKLVLPKVLIQITEAVSNQESRIATRDISNLSFLTP